MGRGGRGGGRGRFRGKNKGRGGGGGGARDTRTESWNDIQRKNELFESYYRMGGFLEEAEFEEMWKYLATDLPNSFRFTGTKSDALAVREIFKKRYIPAIQSMDFEGEPVQPPQAVAAFPDELVWDMKTHKKVIRRYAPFAEFQKFLVAETTSGNISRQEVVSMIPPHFLDVKPGMVVLDMCAAPGSKTAQLAEMIHGDEEERVAKAARNEDPNVDGEGDYSDDGRSTGLLIANDSDYKRAGMLTHQVKRLNFPNLIVTNHDAAIFPSVELPPLPSGKKQYLKYDRILADVPCSGDGTARKNPNVWSKWTPKDGLGLHNLQLRILFRGLQMLKKGGRLVYSTCSMNPVENEAVVAAAIEACGGISKVQLADASGYLPNLKRKPGLNKWKVYDTSAVPGGEKTAHLFNSWDAFVKAKQKYDTEEPERQFSSKISPGCFPPTETSEEERIPLERCVRVYPHLQDTGGFFIAILEKVDDIKIAQISASDNTELLRKAMQDSEATTPTATTVEPSDAPEQPNSAASPSKRKLDDVDVEKTEVVKKVKTEEAPLQQPVTDSDTKAGAETSVKASNGAVTKASGDEPSKSKGGQQSSKEYFEWVPADDPSIAQILDFFGISSRFPRDRFMVKNKEGLLLNKIYYTSELAKTVINQNKNRGMKFIHCGVVMFVSHKIKDAELMKAPWRLQNEGIRILEPWAEQRIVKCTNKSTLYKLLIEMFPKMPKDGSHDIGEVGDQLSGMDIGCCFVRIEQSEGEDGFPFRMVLPLWRHPGSANLMVDKDDRKAMLLRLYNEKDPQIKNHVAEKAAAAAAEEQKLNELEAKEAEEEASKDPAEIEAKHAMEIEEEGSVKLDDAMELS
ncbi:S-adenosyl-L-methionine-dependent methyltransferase [Paraphaeosphaeria sporulosa]|uniref:S-adenosyl-L-methionine-dependent methyltransferase n=1 Tax=Paraphaeosphaeria sporulosa TaxID=1460663 RepID=A0A177CX56_9PLEO|nr:S-adenosyl-L-methionine-dependent methyltransferase [Paraphaeosphaeria sporulosa]OAG12135.1 S-adenosyl-L-methionine-dependent methyltransferase [Paraphaeosphaeria sporulosa]